MNEVSYFYLNNNNQLVISPMVSLSMWRGCAVAQDRSRFVWLSIVVIMVARGGGGQASTREPGTGREDAYWVNW